MNRINRNHSNLYTKLGAYALACVAPFIAPVVAKAEIQYVAVNQTFTSADDNSFYIGYAADPDDPPFVLQAVAAETPSNGTSVVAAGNILTDGSTSTSPVFPLAAALSFGAAIDPTDPANFGDTAIMADSDSTDPTHWSLTGGDAYLGFAFSDGDGNEYAGWAHITTTADDDTSSFELLGYAYDTDPNTVITAGEGEVAPEPSSLALLALGGAGLLAYRRRRLAAV